MRTTVNASSGGSTCSMVSWCGILFLAGLVCIHPVRPLEGCECPGWDGTVEEGVLDSLVRSEFVFAGTTVSVEVVTSTPLTMVWTVAVTEIWKGDDVEDVAEVVEYDPGFSCSSSFELGTRYVIFGQRGVFSEHPNSFYTEFCDWTAPYEARAGFLGPSSPPAPRPFLRGDADGTGDHTLNDAIVVLDYLFLAGAGIDCVRSADSNDSGNLDVTDPVYVLNYLFRGGLPPPLPFGECGIDPTPDGLGCETVPECA